MSLFLKLWAVLLAVYIVTATGFSVVALGHLDLRYGAYVDLVVIAPIQAALIWALSNRRAAWDTLSAPAHLLRAQPWLGATVLADFVLVCIAWQPDPWSFADLNNPGSLPGIYNGLRCVAAGVLVSTSSAPLTRSRTLSRFFSVGLIVLGIDFIVGPSAVSGWLIHGSVAVAAALLLARMQRDWTRSAPHSAGLLSWTLLLAAAAVLVRMIGTFNSPDLTPGAETMVGTLAYLAVGSLWLAVIALPRGE